MSEYHRNARIQDSPLMPRSVRATLRSPYISKPLDNGSPLISSSDCELPCYDREASESDDSGQNMRIAGNEAQHLLHPPTRKVQAGTSRGHRALKSSDSEKCLKALCPKLRDGTFGPPPLLFRVWNEVSGGFNSPLRFEAGNPNAFDFVSPRDLPLRDPSLLCTASKHINGRHDFGAGSGSPFISTTPSLVWALDKSCKLEGQAHIAVLDGNAATTARHWWFANSLRPGANDRETPLWPIYYHGSHEWLVAGTITSEAFLGPSISLESLRRLATISAAVNDLLQLETISSRKTGQALCENIEVAFLDKALGIGLGQLAAFVRPAFENSTLNEPLLASFVTTILYSFGEAYDPKTWLKCHDFKKGVLQGLSEGARLAVLVNNAPIRMDLEVGVLVSDVSWKSLDKSQHTITNGTHALTLPAAPRTPSPTQSYHLYSTPISMRKREMSTKVIQQDEDEDENEDENENEDALSDVIGSDDELLQRAKRETTNAEHGFASTNNLSNNDVLADARGAISVDEDLVEMESSVTAASDDSMSDASTATLDGVLLIG